MVEQEQFRSADSAGTGVGNDSTAWTNLAAASWNQNSFSRTQASTEASTPYDAMRPADMSLPALQILPDTRRLAPVPQNASDGSAFPSTPDSYAPSGSDAQVAAIPRVASPYFDEGVKLYQAGNVAESIKYFTQAANSGDSWAQTQLGLFYEKGEGVPQDLNMAAQWYKKGADSGDPQAMKNLGQLYEYGAGVQEDWTAAAKYYQMGASLGNPSAEAALARAYQFGIGVPQSRDNALQWDQKALDDGNTDSEEWVRKLSDPTNNIGFRNDDEQAEVMGNSLRTSPLLLGADPAGISFRNSAERMNWLTKLRAAVDADEQIQPDQTDDPNSTVQPFNDQQ